MNDKEKKRINQVIKLSNLEEQCEGGTKNKEDQGKKFRNLEEQGGLWMNDKEEKRINQGK